MTTELSFHEGARLPAPGDNVAIAGRRLEAGAVIAHEAKRYRLAHTILEGHRFAIEPITEGEPLLSWGLPFGFATRQILPGDYVCNAKILEALRTRRIDFALPDLPNFRDYLMPYLLDESAFKPGCQVSRHLTDRFFDGYQRGPRGVGTRNFIVLLGTSSRTASFVRLLAERFREIPKRFPNIDGVVAVAHTEGGGASLPNNLEMILRALAGFCVHPNVAAVLAVDLGIEPVNNRVLRTFLEEGKYPIDELPHQFFTVRDRHELALSRAEAVVSNWLQAGNSHRRAPCSVEHLKVALQCGGSDAFSGISGNPLAGWVAKEVIRYGGMANLAETDELIGAEPYVLSNVRNLATAREFLKTLERFQERVAWHGHSAEGNPSGGNNYRGLYNIAIKSIGAARKKDPDVRLDYVVRYGERMSAPGFYFMDSPGNDLESIAGQVASGCNLILFTTGNGSITNFPFVPTIKIMTNTGRFRMLSKEMDVNAGRYQDGVPMEILGAETLDLALKIASGERSTGERAGHSQVQIWREWRQTNPENLRRVLQSPRPSGQPIPLREAPAFPAADLAAAMRGKRFRVVQNNGRFTTDEVGLIVPTSLCSGQIAKMIADRINRSKPAGQTPECVGRNWRCVALAHTEGCGNSGGDSERLYMRTMAGYLVHPFVRKGLLLEHGCERTHNDAMRVFLDEQHLDEKNFGWASVQLDGGIESVSAKVIGWFQAAVPPLEPITKEAGIEELRIGLFSAGELPEAVLDACALMIGVIVRAGGTVVIPENASLLRAERFCRSLFLEGRMAPTLEYGEPFAKAGLHIMATPTDHAVETLTGLGATGVEVMLAHVADAPLPGNPMVPLLQVASASAPAIVSASMPADDLDLVLSSDEAAPAQLAERLLDRVFEVLSHRYKPKLSARGHVDFQMTRGFLGVSL